MRWAWPALSMVVFALGCRPVTVADAETRDPPVGGRQRGPAEIRVALTFDDLPGEPGSVDAIVEALEQYGTPPAFGFVNGQQVANDPAQEDVLVRWVAAGHRLGNHTYSHPHMARVGVKSFVDDIEANEPLLARVVGSGPGAPSWKFFRYPFLEQGYDADSTARVRAHLFESGYQIAEVSIDFGDWAWNPVYERCSRRGDGRAIAALEQSFVNTAVSFLHWSDEAGVRAFGRSIPHVLLLHAGAFDGRMLSRLLGAYERQGVVWISLEEALDDDAYRKHQPPGRTHGDSLLEQVIATENADHPPWVQQPLALLDALCREVDDASGGPGDTPDRG